MVTKHISSIYIYKSLLINVSVSLIVSGVLPHMALLGYSFCLLYFYVILLLNFPVHNQMNRYLEHSYAPYYHPVLLE